MEGPRSPTENEFDRVLDFLNGQLRPDSQWSIAQEYPTALSTTNLHNMRIITENERILSHAVLKPLIVKTPHVVLKVGAIGSVVTDESARGQGLSTWMKPFARTATSPSYGPRFTTSTAVSASNSRASNRPSSLKINWK